MSIYASGRPIGTHRDPETFDVGDYPYGYVRTRDGWDGGGVNTYPTNESGLHAEISVDPIPAHCVPGNIEDWRGGYGDRVRLSFAVGDAPGEPMTSPTPAGQLILDREAALHLAADLLSWATTITASPKTGARKDLP